MKSLDDDDEVGGSRVENLKLQARLEMAMSITSNGGDIPTNIQTELYSDSLRLIWEDIKMSHSARVRALYNSNPQHYATKKIQWIKDVRAATGLGLRDAKELVDIEWRKLGLSPSP